MEIDEAQAKPTNIQNIDKSNARMLITRDRTSKPFLKLSTFLTRQIIQSIIDIKDGKHAKRPVIGITDKISEAIAKTKANIAIFFVMINL